MSRSRNALGTGVLLVAGLVLAACDAGPPPPNLLLISIDTLRSDHLGCYGYGRRTSPAIDRFASQGALFENAYASGPATTESHASLFTGRHPYQHGAYSGIWTPLALEETTLAEILAERGFATFALVSSVRFDERSNFAQGFETYRNLDAVPKNDRGRAVTTLAIQHLREAGGAPFFGFLHYFGPHQPYGPPEPFRSRFHPGPESLLPGGSSAFIRDFRIAGTRAPPEALAYLEALYDAEILYLDRELRRLFRALDVLDLADSTLVVFLSDHGEEFQEHGGLSHAHALYEELLRIPLLLRWPGRIAAGQRIERPVQLVDVLPTILELVGAPAPPALPGRSLVPDLLGERTGSELDVVIGQRNPGSWSLAASLPEGRFKLIAEAGQPRRLFRLSDDPGERRDVSARFPDARERLEEIAAGHDGLADPKGRARGPTEMPDDLGRRLREIGYLEDDGGEAPATAAGGAPPTP